MTFQTPQMLVALALLPVLFLLYSMAQRRRREYTVRFTNLALLQEVVGKSPGVRRHIPPLLYLFGTAALLISLARPQAVVAVPREQAAVMLAIDTSGSMSATDLDPDRLGAARQAARAFVDGLPENVQVGLVSFREFSSVRVPLTRNHKMVERGIDMLYADGGTAIGEAIFMAIDQLSLRETDEEGDPGPAVVVILSDGESNQGRSPVEAAALAHEAGIPVYTVGIGTRDQPVIIASGQTVSLDERTLQAVAEITEAEYFYAAETDALTKIYTDLSSQVAWLEEYIEVTALAAGFGTLLFLIGGILSLRWFQQFP